MAKERGECLSSSWPDRRKYRSHPAVCLRPRSPAFRHYEMPAPSPVIRAPSCTSLRPIARTGSEASAPYPALQILVTVPVLLPLFFFHFPPWLARAESRSFPPSSRGILDSPPPPHP